MKSIIYISLLLFLSSCDSKTDKQSKVSQPAKPKINSNVADSVLVLKYKIDVSDRNIKNSSDRKVDLLFNGVDNHLGGQRNPKVNFHTECMFCEPVQKFRNGLLFAKRLLITSDEIKYYKTDFNIPDSSNLIKLVTPRERNNPRFSFEGGKGRIKYLGISCNDADFNKTKLSFETGDVVVDSIINVSFFEYDLNSDGQKEQYLLGSRSCSQELVILRVRKNSDKL